MGGLVYQMNGTLQLQESLIANYEAIATSNNIENIQLFIGLLTELTNKLKQKLVKDIEI